MAAGDSGAAANYNNAAAGRSQERLGLFGGLKTGPSPGSARADLVDDRSLPGGGVKMLATLVEANGRSRAATISKSRASTWIRTAAWLTMRRLAGACCTS